MKKSKTYRANIFGVWATALVPVALVAVSGCSHDRDDLEPRDVSVKTPTPVIDRDDMGRYDTAGATPSAGRNDLTPRGVTTPPAPVDTTPGDDTIRERRGVIDSDVNAVPSGTTGQPGTIDRRSSDPSPTYTPAQPGYIRNSNDGTVFVQPGVVQPGAVRTPGTDGGSVPPGQTQQPGTPGEGQPRTPRFHEAEQNTSEKNPRPAQNGQTPAANPPSQNTPARTPQTPPARQAPSGTNNNAPGGTGAPAGGQGAPAGGQGAPAPAGGGTSGSSGQR